MGSKKSCLIIFMVFSSLLSSIVFGASDTYDTKALDTLFYYHANQTMAQHQTGSLTQVSLPSNFSGMNVFVIALRNRRLWSKGINSSFIEIPSKVMTLPYVKRLAVVYHNLGKWSSKYYKVPGYSLVSPVVGFNVYDSSNTTTLSDKKVTLNTTSEPISIYFSYVEAEDKNVTQFKCIKFGEGGLVEITNMTKRDFCVTRTSGSFSVAASSMAKKKGRIWKWWVTGFVAGVVVVVVLILAGIAIVRTWKRKKIKTMGKESETGMTLDTFWVDGDKMPMHPWSEPSRYLNMIMYLDQHSLIALPFLFLFIEFPFSTLLSS